MRSGNFAARGFHKQRTIVAGPAPIGRVPHELDRRQICVTLAEDRESPPLRRFIPDQDAD